jgi:hypothetical protein
MRMVRIEGARDWKEGSGEQQSGVEFVLELEVNQTEVVMSGSWELTAQAESRQLSQLQLRYRLPGKTR